MVFLSLVKKRATFTLSYRLIHALCESRLWEDIHQCTVFFPTSKNKLFSFNAISQFLVSSLAHFSNNSELGTSFIPTAHVLAAGSFPFLGDVASPCFSARLNFLAPVGFVLGAESTECLVRNVTVSGKVDDEFPGFFYFGFCLFPFSLLVV